MPTYEYHCPKCEATYELRQGFDAETTQKCIECGKGTAKRVLHAPRVHFKGSGFYVTDSKGKNPAAEGTDSSSKSESESAPSEAKAEPAKAEAKKPEAKKSEAASSGEAAAS
ncbi:MAG TPA: zinc ribbon domain-containing protein [Tepidiformaceae bacterium]|jgi:putative FmdB family regulatory protein